MSSSGKIPRRSTNLSISVFTLALGWKKKKGAFFEDAMGEVIRFFKKKKAWKKKVQHETLQCKSAWVYGWAELLQLVQKRMCKWNILYLIFTKPQCREQTAEFRESTTGSLQASKQTPKIPSELQQRYCLHGKVKRMGNGLLCFEVLHGFLTKWAPWDHVQKQKMLFAVWISSALVGSSEKKQLVGLGMNLEQVNSLFRSAT